MEEPTISLNISGMPVSYLQGIDAVSNIRSRAVVILVGEALAARAKIGAGQPVPVAPYPPYNIPAPQPFVPYIPAIPYQPDFTSSTGK